MDQQSFDMQILMEVSLQVCIYMGNKKWFRYMQRLRKNIFTKASDTCKDWEIIFTNASDTCKVLENIFTRSVPTWVTKRGLHLYVKTQTSERTNVMVNFTFGLFIFYRS